VAAEFLHLSSRQDRLRQRDQLYTARHLGRVSAFPLPSPRYAFLRSRPRRSLQSGTGSAHRLGALPSYPASRRPQRPRGPSPAMANVRINDATRWRRSRQVGGRALRLPIAYTVRSRRSFASAGNGAALRPLPTPAALFGCRQSGGGFRLSGIAETINPAREAAGVHHHHPPAQPRFTASVTIIDVMRRQAPRIRWTQARPTRRCANQTPRNAASSCPICPPSGGRVSAIMAPLRRPWHRSLSVRAGSRILAPFAIDAPGRTRPSLLPQVTASTVMLLE